MPRPTPQRKLDACQFCKLWPLLRGGVGHRIVPDLVRAEVANIHVVLLPNVVNRLISFLSTFFNSDLVKIGSVRMGRFLATCEHIRALPRGFKGLNRTKVNSNPKNFPYHVFELFVIIQVPDVSCFLADGVSCEGESVVIADQ